MPVRGCIHARSAGLSGGGLRPVAAWAWLHRVPLDLGRSARSPLCLPAPKAFRMTRSTRSTGLAGLLLLMGLGCSTRQAPTTWPPLLIEVPEKKQTYQLVRRATPEEVQVARFTLGPGDEAWVYTTILGFLNTHSGVCVLHNRRVVASSPIFSTT